MISRVSAIPATMHAVLLVGHGGPEQLVYRTDVPVPVAQAGDVLLEVRAAGVNNTDLNTRVGWYAASGDAETGGGRWAGDAFAFPRIQGADVCGIVAAVGPGVDSARVGERVIVQGCLRSLAREGREPWLGSELDGGFAQYVRAPAADTYHIECTLSDAQLAAVPCSYATAENLLHRSGVCAGERVLVTGASGGVGSAAVLLARRRGAEVLAVAGDEKADAVLALGASAVLPRNGIEQRVGREKVDVVIDVVGGSYWSELLDILRPRGRYAVAGAIGGPTVALDLRTLYLKDLSLYGCTSQDATVFSDLVSYLERGELVPIVSASYPLAAIAEAQAAFAAKQHVGKIVLVPPPVAS